MNLELFHLTNPLNDISISCHLADYQFPHLENYTDGNWLNIQLVVNHRQKRFEKIDPALQVQDFQRMYDWFEALHQRKLPRYATLVFMEPCLAFSFLAQDLKKVCISVNLKHELKPKFWLKQSGFWFGLDWQVQFDVSAGEFEQILHNLQTAMAHYPVRGQK